MANIFMVRIEDDDLDTLRQKYGDESLQGTLDEQAIRNFMKESGVERAQVWQVR